jgi:hypothetical protein
MSKVKRELSESKFLCWNFIKTFYLLEKEDMFSIYKKINKDIELTPAKWNKFVNSKEIHDYVYTRIIWISDELLYSIAYSESAGNLGIEMHTDDFVVYIATPMIIHDNISSIEQQAAAHRQIATRAFTTMLCHMFFKDLYGKPFSVLKEDEGWFSLNEKYEYIAV